MAARSALTVFAIVRAVVRWSTGCLCDMHPRYQPLNEWNHGFTIVETDNRGNYQVNNYKIINNEIYHG